MAVRRDHRRRLALLTAALFALLLCPFFPALAADYDPAHPENLTTEHLNAQACILIEKDSGDVIFEKNADAMMYPASTTKIMTAYLALTMADVSETTVCSPTALAVPEDSSSARLVAGEQVNLLDLVYVTMLKSANDGANVIAEAVSGSIPAFVDLMNQAADVLGCTGTHFANAHGLHDENHYTHKCERKRHHCRKKVRNGCKQSERRNDVKHSRIRFGIHVEKLLFNFTYVLELVF